MPRPATAALPLVLLAAACASDWREVSAAGHPALAPDARIVARERGTGPGRERRFEIRTPDGERAPATTQELAQFARPIDGPDAAIAFLDLARRSGVLPAASAGHALAPDPALGGQGSSGRYSRDDAVAWGVDFEPAARPYAGGWEVTHVVLFPPVPDPDHPKYATPWRLALCSEIVYPDGTVQPTDRRTLTNGRDAARYAPY